MDLPKEIEVYVKEMIDDTLGLPISAETLRLKLRSEEDAHRRLRDQYYLLLDKLHHKDELIDRAKAEASMNAVAIKKFVEENQRLAMECANLVVQCDKLEKECALYDNDREALMDFGNEADERAKEAELKVHGLQEELGKLQEELEFYKNQSKIHPVDSSAERSDKEANLLETVLTTVVQEKEIKSAHMFLEANCGHDESYSKLLRMWSRLRPSTQRVLSLAAKVTALQQDKEHLKVNLTKAEDEVKLLFEENNILDKENKKLWRQQRRERSLDGSGGKLTSGGASGKSNKRKLSSKLSSPGEMKIDSKEIDSLRQPLSPLQHNSPDCRMHKK